MAAGIGGLSYWRMSSRPLTGAELIAALPPDDATHVYVNFEALRRGGILEMLAGSKAAEDPDYRKFVAETAFDYRSDLDSAAVAFLHGDTYFALRGRFDFAKLSSYARAQGGGCASGICSMPASAPGRSISFYLLRRGVLAMAVSREQRGASLIGPGQWKTTPQIPADPIWISAPSFAFSDVSALPEGTHAFLSPLAHAQQITFAAGPQGERFAIRFEANCATATDAAALTKQLSDTTELLKKMLAREHMTPNARDLSGILVAGNFEQRDRLVFGTWPVERGFIEALGKTP
jgi:hypothetical protein